MSKVNASLKKIVDDPSYQETIDKAGALCKEYPKLGKVEVTYHAYEEEAKAIAKGMDALQKVIVKGKAKKNFTEADSARIDDIVNDVNKARQSAGKKDNTVTLTEGVSLLSTLLIALKNQTEEKATEGVDAPIDSMSPEASRIMLKAIGAQKQLGKSSVAVNTRGALSLRNGIRKAVKQKKSLEKAEAKAAKAAEKETKESVELDDNMMESFADLDSDFNASELLESVFAELHQEPTPEPESAIEESAEELENEIQNHYAYMTQLQDEILGYHTESTVENVEDDDIDKILEEATAEVMSDAADDTYNPEHSNPPEKDVPESAEDDETTDESTDEPVTKKPVPEENQVTESTEETMEDGTPEFDVDAMLAEAALSAGIEPDEDEVDALLEKYGVKYEAEEPVANDGSPKALLESFNDIMGISVDDNETEPEE